MEYAFAELLTREDMLRILQEERKISGISDLADSDLRRIFKSFVIPLGKRDTSKGKQKKSPLKRPSSDSIMDIDGLVEPNKQMKFSNSEELNETSFYYEEKRPRDFDDYMDDLSLSSATKRIKITLA